MRRRHKRVAVTKPVSKGLRTCVGCFDKFEPGSLVRVVVDPMGQFLVDRRQKAPGRGAYVCYDAACLERAEKNRGLQRALKAPQTVVPASEIARQVVEFLDQRIIDLLSIAAVAKETVSGMDALSRATHLVNGYVVATDVASATEEKVRRWASATGVPVVVHEQAEMLGETQGKPARVVIGVCEASRFRAIMTAIERRNRVLVAASDRNS